MANPVTDNELIKAFDALLLEDFHEIEQRPDGFGITIKEICEAKGVSESTARRFLLGAVEKKGWKRKQMRTGESRPIWVYYK